jgi:hypothetical protein
MAPLRSRGRPVGVPCRATTRSAAAALVRSQWCQRPVRVARSPSAVAKCPIDTRSEPGAERHVVGCILLRRRNESFQYPPDECTRRHAGPATRPSLTSRGEPDDRRHLVHSVASPSWDARRAPNLAVPSGLPVSRIPTWDATVSQSIRRCARSPRPGVVSPRRSDSWPQRPGSRGG